VPEEQFERGLQDSDMPTTSGLIEAANPKPVATEALRLWSTLRETRLVYYGFDLLHLDGRDVWGLPLVER
jgi:hypothetical protein